MRLFNKRKLIVGASMIGVLLIGFFVYHAGYYVIFDESRYAYSPDEDNTEGGVQVISGPRPRFFGESDIHQTGWWGDEWYFDLYRSKIRAFCDREGCEWPMHIRAEHGSIVREATL